MFFRYLWQDPRFFVAAVFLVAFSVCCHEFMHAFTALQAAHPYECCAYYLFPVEILPE